MAQNINKLNRCSFCRYFTGRSCMVTPNSAYCREATDELYKYLRDAKTATPVKSLRSWDRK